MHPDEERPPQEYWEADEPPDPTGAQTAEEFVAELDVLLQWSGLSLEEIEHRARAYGGFLPEGTVADVLRGNAPPSEDLLVKLLWAVGCDDETVELWVWARGQLPSKAHEPPKYSEGALAHAVKERRNRDGWRGLHRRAVPDAGETRASHALSAGWSSRAMIGAVAAGVIALTTGIVVTLTGGDESAGPPAARGDGRQASPAPGAQTSADPLASILATATATPSTSKPAVSPTPRPSATTTRSPQPTPTQTETQSQTPRLTGSGGASCAQQDNRWFVNVTVTANLSGAAAGDDPRGRANHSGTVKTFSLTGSGGTSFSGQASFDVGPDTAPAQGTISWTATVTVPGRGTVTADGDASFSCGG